MQTLSESAIKVLCDTYTERAKVRNALGVADLYTKDAIIMVSGRVVAQGLGEIARFLAEEYSADGWQPPQVTTLLKKVDFYEWGKIAIVPERFVEHTGRNGRVFMHIILVDGVPKISLESILYTC